jgi:hypothetical protein
VDIPDVSNWSHQFDASSADCFVFVMKEGILSAVAHDLKLQIQEFEVAVDETSRSVAAIFNADSATVVSAMKQGEEDPYALSVEQKTQIELSVRLDVLRSREFPDIVFVSESVTDSEAGYLVRGTLEIRNKPQSIIFPVRPANGRLVAEAIINQPDFGIEPFSTMMGAIRVRPAVMVRISFPAP